jgi:acetylornithine/N-succinyldiaminopimelate aminotransferase
MSGSALYETFARAPLAFDRGEGTWLITDKGERYLDFAGGIAVNSLGHSHPHLVAALTEQAAKLWHVSNLYEIPGRAGSANGWPTPLRRQGVLHQSGAEALNAYQTARRYHFVKGHPERFRVITFEGAFHGRTLAPTPPAASKYLEGFDLRSKASTRSGSTTSTPRKRRSRRRPPRS